MDGGAGGGACTPIQSPRGMCGLGPLGPLPVGSHGDGGTEAGRSLSPGVAGPASGRVSGEQPAGEGCRVRVVSLPRHGAFIHGGTDVCG